VGGHAPPDPPGREKGKASRESTLLLADAAQAIGGKLYILGGGWSVIVPGTPFAVAVKLEVPWSQATDRHVARLELVDEDGQAVEAPTAEDAAEPVMHEEHFCTGIPPGVKAGTPLDHVFTLTVLGLPLAPGTRYEWRLSIDRVVQEDWHAAFTTLPVVAAEAA
jgi:Family of unknown function (DUF6941)